MFLCLYLCIAMHMWVYISVYLYIAMHAWVQAPLEAGRFLTLDAVGLNYSCFDPSGVSTRSWICVFLKIDEQYTLLTDEPSLQPPYLTYFWPRKIFNLHKLQRWIKHICHCPVTNGYFVGLQSVSPWSNGDWKLFTRALDENVNRFSSRMDAG